MKVHDPVIEVVAALVVVRSDLDVLTFVAPHADTQDHPTPADGLE
jgi:hypothetical protein